MEAVKTSALNPVVQRQAAAASSMAIVSKRSNVSVQPSLKVSSVSDSSEVEAVSISKKIMRMPGPGNSMAYTNPGSGTISRLAQNVSKEKIQRDGDGTPAVSPELNARIQGSLSEGNPLPDKVRSFMEPRFKANFSKVKVHTSEKSAAMNVQLSAKAFTVGSNIFFGKGQFQPESNEGKELIAHELTHTIQQGAAIQRSEDVSVSQNTSIQIQRWGIDDALDFFAEKANNIPGFAMLTYIIGVNPVNMRSVDRNATNLLRGIIGFMPGGEMIFQALQSNGIIERVGNWAQQQLNTLSIAGSSLKHALDDFLHSLSWSDVLHLDDVWERAKRIFTDPINRIKNFVVGLVTDILKFIRDAILRPVAALANGTRGYDLVKGVMGMDPITGDTYERTPENMIGGFMKLIGQEEKWNNLRESNAVGRAWVWFQQQVRILLGFVREIPQLFTTAWERLGIGDMLNIPGAFSKIANIFGGFIERFVTWAGEAALQVIKFIFEVLAPGAMDVLNKAMQVFGIIIRDPIRFVGNLVRAGVQGFRQFSTNILTHLRNGLVGWLTGSLTGAGLQLPEVWNLRGILSLVLQILGLTWQNIRTKILRHIPEPVLRTLETTFDIVVTLVREGPMAAWNKILEQLGNLQEMVFGQIREWIQSTIVGQAIIKIASMLNPAGAIIQAIMAIYNTVLFFKERAEQIRQVMEAFFNSIANIAAGNVSGAATFVENAMARTVPVIISFLARLIGLGGISERIRAIIDRIRQPIDRALDKVVDWIVAQARRFGTAAVQGARDVAGRVLQWWRERRTFRNANNEEHTISMNEANNHVQLIIQSTPMPLLNYINGSNLSESKKEEARVIVRRMQALEITSARDRTPVDQRAQSIANDLRMLVAILSNGATAGPAPDPVYTWASNKPTQVLADRITKSKKNTSGLEPRPVRNSGTTGWSLLYQDGSDNQIEELRERWVQMHLINGAKFGGRGIPGNLVPGPQSLNSSAAQTRFDTSVYNQFLERGQTIWITADVVYYSETGLSDFAKQINLKAGTDVYNSESQEWRKTNNVLVQTTLSVVKPAIANNNIQINLNHMGTTAMRASGISILRDQSVLDFIVNNRPYTSVRDLLNKITTSTIMPLTTGKQNSVANFINNNPQRFIA